MQIRDKLGRLRIALDEDMPGVLEWRNAPAVRKNSYSQDVILLSDHLNWWRTFKLDQTTECFIYEFQNVPTGVVSLTNIDLVNQRASWAFYAAPNAARGTGKRMEYLALDYAFETLQLNKLCCEVLSFNVPVLGLHKAFGFKSEGLLKEQRMIADQFEDIVLLAMFRKDWMRSRSEKLDALLASSG